ncbi:selenocysteine-specific translation elongation factor [Mariniblastus sp.]|nr:selenocysteine-specific translation elongation factor [Mariniblastus sp.]
MLKDLILGTAGHIDHGKTSLIGALTGTNTDRLPEEQKRGITIELGYAHLDLPPFRLGIVDVPGHEKFVRQMLAGATGMDLALLVVAGDDSIKQQTKEHLDILRMLDLPAGVIALTKCDLSDPEWLDLVEDEIRQMVAGTFLENAPIIRTSSKTGMGVEELKNALRSAAETVAQTDRANRQDAPYRMAIDRTFTIDGYGTVVTGSVSSGRVSVGDQIQIQPGDRSVRVRGIQNHDSASETVSRGQRAAINLAGVHHLEIDRGHELCATGHLLPSTLMTVKLHLLDRLSKPLKDRTRVRFHVGTAELFGNLRLLGVSELEPGQECYAQVFLNDAAVAVWNQPFVVRLQSPVVTIGGGRVLMPNAKRIKKATDLDLEMISDLTSLDPLTRSSASVYLSDDLGWTPVDLARSAGVVGFEEIFTQLKDRGDLIEIPVSMNRSVKVHRSRFEHLADRIIKALERLHRLQPLRFTHPRSALNVEFKYLDTPELLDLVVEELKREKKIIANVNSVGIVGYGPKLSKGQKALLGELIEIVRKAGLKVPTVTELEASAKKNKESVRELLEMASENGDLLKIAPEYYIHGEVVEETKRKLVEEIEAANGLTMSEIRQILDTSRKYAIPLCEYFDKTGFTKRDGDKRLLGTDEKN